MFLCSFVNRKIHCKRSNCTLIPCLVLPNTIVGVLAVGLHSWVAVRCGRNKQPRQNQTGYNTAVEGNLRRPALALKTSLGHSQWYRHAWEISYRRAVLESACCKAMLVCAQFAELRQAQDRALSRGICTFVPNVIELPGGNHGVD